MGFDPAIVLSRSPTRILIGLVLIEILLVVVYLTVGPSSADAPHFHGWFDLDAETNIPAMFSSLQLFVIGGSFLLINLREDPPVKVPSRALLWTCTLIFVFLSLDEAVGIHEFITRAARRTEWMPRSGFKGGKGMWIYLYFMIGSISAIVLYWLKREELKRIWVDYRPEVVLILAGAGIFLSGAVALEVFSYQYLREDLLSVSYRAGVAAEEFLEMAGASVILYGVLRLKKRVP